MGEGISCSNHVRSGGLEAGCWEDPEKNVTLYVDVKCERCRKIIFLDCFSPNSNAAIRATNCSSAETWDASNDNWKICSAHIGTSQAINRDGSECKYNLWVNDICINFSYYRHSFNCFLERVKT